MRKRFQEIYGYPPTFFVRSPGRVNLIGEHVDYSDYPVLPMAIEQDTVIAVGISKKNLITLSNMNNEKFPQKIFNGLTFENVSIEKVHTWSNYFVCGFKGVLEHLNLKESKAMDLLVDGRVPIGSGLSSSSALVCVSALAVMFSNDLNIDQRELATLCAKCERYMGMQSGGMDQAISILGKKGIAKLIQFNPLQTFDILLPKNACFIVANSLVEANKYATASSGYNQRVAETRLGSVILAKGLNLSDWKNVITLHHVQKLSKLSFDELLQATEKHLDKSPYDVSSISKALELDEQTVREKYITAKVGDTFHIYKRVKHVFTESQRVRNFESLCKKENSDPETLLKDLGQLMNESHYSCRDFFECSCTELDELTDFCRKNGAYGSRLTGAGWGGWTVVLVHSDRSLEFLNTIIENFYKPRTNEYSQSVKISKPGSGGYYFSD
eukprot:TRINITY_DN15973_c0_g1_i1.p1 TRINITY_DN15973_c0_g1~~TRINITY_DN15973_c0_g1_i1.p1  ORF type:complete len:469 (-),score=114.37 TRINITY_DN15973_c0_g1_i1:40-1362(-)